MNLFNSISTSIFDVLLERFGPQSIWIDLVLWSVIAGVIALVVYKYVSNQDGIARSKDLIKMHLLEIRLFRNDIVQVLKSTVSILGRNGQYLGYNLLPMVVLMVPFMAVLVQLVSHYGYSPAQVGDVELLEVQLEPGQDVMQLQLALPDGVSLDAPAVRTADGEAYWRLRADAPGDHKLTLSLGGTELVKTWAVGGEPRQVPVMLTKSWDALLYPGEGVLSADSPFYDVRIAVPPRPLPYLPDGELGVMTFFLVVSLVAGFAVKGPLGVTI